MLATIQRWMLIHPGEGRIVLHPFLLYLTVGAGLSLGRASGDAVLISRVGLDMLPYLLLATGPLLALVSGVYAAFVDRVAADVLFRRLLIGLGVYLAVLAAVMGGTHAVPASALYILGYMVASEILLVHLNHYALSFFDPMQGRRLFPTVAAGARLGGIMGGAAMGLLSSVAPVEAMALGWVVMLALAGALIGFRRGSNPVAAPARVRRKSGEHPLSDLVDGLRFARGSRLLQTTGIGMVLLVVLVSIQDYLTNAIFAAHFDDETRLAAFLGWFVAGANALTLALQLLVTNRLLRRFGVKTVNLVFPLTTFASFAALAGVPGLFAAVAGRLNTASALPAFRHPAANLFYHAFPARLQGRARAFVAGAMLPLGFAVSGALLILVPADRLIDVLAWGGLVVAAALIANDVVKNRLYGESLMAVVRDLVFLGHGDRVDSSARLDPTVIERIGALLREAGDHAFSETCVEILARAAPADAVAIVAGAEGVLDNAVRDRAIRILAGRDAPGWDDLARRYLVAGDEHLRTTALGLLVRRAHDPCHGIIDDWLASPHPRLKAAATEFALADADASRRRHGEQALEALFDSADAGHVVAGIGVVERLGGQWLSRVKPFAEHGDVRLRAAAVRCLAAAAGRAGPALPDLDALVEKALADPAAAVRAAGVLALPAMADATKRLSLAATALRDLDAGVRLAAEEIVPACLPPEEDATREILHAFAGDFAMQVIMLRAIAARPLPLRAPLLRAIAAFHVDLAARKQDKALRLRLERARGTAAFLYEVLCEDVEGHLDATLAALEGLEAGIAVPVVRAGLGSRDRRLRALAIESLRAMDDDPLAARTRTVLEKAFELRGADALSSAASAAPGAGAPTGSMSESEWSDILRWCGAHGSRWLRTCAVAAGAPAEASP